MPDEAERLLGRSSYRGWSLESTLRELIWVHWWPNAQELDRQLAKARSDLGGLEEKRATFLGKLTTTDVEVSLKRKYVADVEEFRNSHASVHAQAELLKPFADRLRQFVEVEGKLRKKRSRLEDELARSKAFEKTHGELAAKAERLDGQVRNRAAAIRSLVPKTDTCPYCGLPLGDDAQLDHIFPVVRGGLSVVENLVWACRPCNELKCELGLFEFLDMTGRDLVVVARRLIDLGKRV
jgi:hypothetical protein